MATHLRLDTKAADAADIAHDIAGGLEADEATASLAPGWRGIAERGDAIALDLRRAKRASSGARARLTVIDARWDRNNAAFSRATLDAAGGYRDAAPYTTFYRAEAASTVNSYGTDREVAFGRGVVRLLDSDAGAALRDPWRARWLAATDALETAGAARTAAVGAEGPFDAAETLFIETFNRELDRLEGSLLGIFPGDRKAVASFLAATRPSPSRKTTEPATDDDPAAE